MVTSIQEALRHYTDSEFCFGAFLVSPESHASADVIGIGLNKFTILVMVIALLPTCLATIIFRFSNVF